jgi:hypothetical protein
MHWSVIVYSKLRALFYRIEFSIRLDDCMRLIDSCMMPFSNSNFILMISSWHRLRHKLFSKSVKEMRHIGYIQWAMWTETNKRIGLYRWEALMPCRPCKFLCNNHVISAESIFQTNPWQVYTVTVLRFYTTKSADRPYECRRSRCLLSTQRACTYIFCNRWWRNILQLDEWKIRLLD